MRARFALPLLLACAACGTTGDGAFAPTLTSADVEKVVPGKTTAVEVQAMLGAPTNKTRSDSGTGETWTYPYRGNQQQRVLYVDVAPGGIVRGKSDSLDFTRGAAYRGP